MQTLSLNDETIDRICTTIRQVSFRGQAVKSAKLTPEAMVVQDADRLDAMGAIGIARAFTYGGHKNRKLHEPTHAPRSFKSIEEYQKNTGPTINHFYEKLLLLNDLMNTSTGKRIAQQRHNFMETYLEQFHLEWDEGTSRSFKATA